MNNKKYKTLKALLELGGIKTFEEFAAHLPYTTLARDTKINPERMKKLFTTDTKDMTVVELIKIANAINIESCLLLDLLK
jgi:hypothetical protein